MQTRQRPTIKPNTAFTIWTCDQVAECTDGLSNELYQALWTKGVKESERLFGYNAPISMVWHVFSQAEQTQLNEVANEQD